MKQANTTSYKLAYLYYQTQPSCNLQIMAELDPKSGMQFFYLFLFKF
jgi:hypothetical protein